MKVLTLHQPWASLIAVGVKTVETRPNRTHIRGRIAIHAGTRKPTGKHHRVGDYRYDKYDDEWWMRPADRQFLDRDGFLPFGEIVATADLVDCVPTNPKEWSGTGYRYGHAMLGDGSNAVLWHPRGTYDWPTQQPYGDFTHGRWAWLLADVEPLDTPVPFKGGQGWSREWSPS